LIIGAGIAATSISLDGLSQSIQTTQSAENSGYSAVIKDYSEKLFGKTKDDPFAILKILKDYYKGQSMNII
jgi:energy-converting hydrogenase Eha subunit A